MRRAPVALALALLLGAAAAPAAVDDPAAARVDYMLNCQGCHLPSGAGAPGVVPDLRQTLGALLSVPGGREFVQRVPGAATASLDDVRLAAVLNWMLDEFSTRPPGFRDFSAREVGRLRQSPWTRVQETRAPLAVRAGIPEAY
jgi:mono/diheme cytochrome c family protein